MQPPVFVLNGYSTVRADYSKRPFLVVSSLALFTASIVLFILVCYRAYSPFPAPLEVSVELITISRLSAAGPECTVEWKLKLVVTNPNNKDGFYLYFDDRLQATLFLHDRWLGGSFMVTTKSLPPPLLLTSETNQTATLNFKMQTDRAYLGEELIEEISRGIIQVHLNVMTRYRLIPTTSKPEEFRLLRLYCPGMGLSDLKKSHHQRVSEFQRIRSIFGTSERQWVEAQVENAQQQAILMAPKSQVSSDEAHIHLDLHSLRRKHAELVGELSNSYHKEEKLLSEQLMKELDEVEKINAKLSTAVEEVTLEHR
ncbi:hypothetical protein EV2_036403 [Malus domestica]